MKLLGPALALLLALPAWAEPRLLLRNGTAVLAHDGSIELRDRTNRTLGEWPGPEDAVALAASSDLSMIAAAASDGRIFTVRNGVSNVTRTTLSPTELLFIGGVLWVLDGYSGSLYRSQSETFVEITSLGPDAALMTHSGGSIYIVARGAGELVRVDTADGRRLGSVSLPGAVADMKLDSDNIYMTLPQRGEVLVLDAEGLREQERFRLGSAPLGIALGPGGNALRAGTIWIADPVLGALIGDERSQSLAAAFSRGFLRGVLGLGVASAEVRRVPGRPSRVMVSGGSAIAQELTTGVLWRLNGKRVLELGRAPAGAFATSDSDDLVVWFDSDSRRLRWNSSR